MGNEEQRDPASGENLPGDEVPAAGSEGETSGPEPQEEGLTVEDILNAEQTGEAASADADSDADAGAGASADAEAGAEAAGQTEADNPYLEDLRRITAEYANYRKRTEANAEVEKQRAVAAVVNPLLSVLDDLDRAEKHDDLVEGTAFATIAQKIRATMERLGVESFGTTGEPFDPSMHEAIAQVPVPGTEEQTVLDVIERGYRIGDVELRPAKVAVAVGADG
ncbi:nucleotide exchange factor GrpE [Leucobacter sp. CSA1]|uniref:Protein GrpE n=1 Tax=Leucobacter chromiisoli TaxID=2796471 RepID=A0A934Q6G0_9MICO|nr:nucleotide exchange factor GrpE [Leucobacter chromiisoli]MBK0417564.1 nucleotide exchange factor GrpE [Leucobacter chromiisoli]